MTRPEENFENLKRLLGCKRYEQPPPGYFFSFSDKVIARIEADEGAGYSSWWAWLLDRFDAKPVLVCAYGLAVSGLLFLGFRLSQVFDAEASVAPSLAVPEFANIPASPLGLLHPWSQNDYSETVPVSLTFRSRTVQRQDFAQNLFATNLFDVRPVRFLGSSY